MTISEDFSGGEFIAVNEPYRLPVLGLLWLRRIAAVRRAEAVS